MLKPLNKGTERWAEKYKYDHWNKNRKVLVLILVSKNQPYHEFYNN